MEPWPLDSVPALEARYGSGGVDFTPDFPLEMDGTVQQASQEPAAEVARSTPGDIVWKCLDPTHPAQCARRGNLLCTFMSITFLHMRIKSGTPENA